MCFAPHGVHFFDMSTSKSAPTLVCFVHFDFEMCFAPQRRALFRHRNFQKWSEREVFLAFSFANVLRATTTCNFSSLIWPADSAPAALASLLFDPPEPQIIGKTQCFATFLPFRASASSFFWLFFFSDLLSSTLLFSLPLPISAFHLSILPEVWLLNFLRQSSAYFLEMWNDPNCIDIFTGNPLLPSDPSIRKGMISKGWTPKMDSFRKKTIFCGSIGTAFGPTLIALWEHGWKTFRHLVHLISFGRVIGSQTHIAQQQIHAKNVEHMCVCMRVCACVCMYVCMDVCMYVSKYEWMNDWMNEWLNEWMNERMNEGTNE